MPASRDCELLEFPFNIRHERVILVSRPTISLNVNGAPASLPAGVDLARALVVLGFGEHRVATAVNGDFVPERQRVETKLTDGDRLEILTARQGG